MQMLSVRCNNYSEVLKNGNFICRIITIVTRDDFVDLLAVNVVTFVFLQHF